MAYPKQIKKTLKLVPDKELSDRRKELSEYITKNGTYLPKSVLHADLDRGMLDFVKEDLKIFSEGNVVPMVDILLTTQNWSQYLETWTFSDSDFNPIPPFITVVRQPEVKYGTNPALQYTIPNRKQFYFAAVPTWNGNQNGMDIYTIPQPVPVDINYSVKIVCLRMRELNQFNKTVLQKFSSRQAYTFIKGQYVPIIMNNVSDESVMEVDKRKYYIQNYDFTMLGYLIDEQEFEVKPAISRVLQVFEIDESKPKRRPKREPENPSSFDFIIEISEDATDYSKVLEYNVNMNIVKTDNVITYDVFINGDFYGTDVSSIPLSTNDTLEFTVVKYDFLESSTISTRCDLI
jgi:hypothetical protein